MSATLDLAAAYEQHAPAIRMWLLARTLDADIADDLLSAVFESALRRQSRYEDRGIPVSAWLYRIAHSRLVDYYRSERRRRHDVSLDVCYLSDDGGVDRVEQRIDTAPIYAGLPRIAPRYQAVLRLRFVEDRSLSETAEALNLTRAGVKALQHRAIAALRQQIGG